MTDDGHSATILVVEDDPDISAALARGLAREGYAVVTASGLSEARRRATSNPPDAAIVDLMLGADSGLDLVRGFRASGAGFPIIILSALSGVEDRANGLEAGADDYVAKPFAFSELLARLKVQERRQMQPARPLRHGGLSFDPGTRRVLGGGTSVELTEKESQLLAVFLRAPGQVFSRQELFQRLWAADGRTAINVVDVYIGYLRRKLRPIADTGMEIGTVRGKGFMLREADRDEN